MPVMEEKPNGPLKTVSYQESPIMSTYLVAVVIGLFDYVEDYTPDGTVAGVFFVVIMELQLLLLIMSNLHLHTGIKVRVYCQVGKANQGKFALDVAVKTLDLYKMYTSQSPEKVTYHQLQSLCTKLKSQIKWTMLIMLIILCHF